MVKENPDNIILHAEDNSRDVHSGIVSAEVVPGMLLELEGYDTVGVSNEPIVAPHSAEGGHCPARVAVELGKAGRTIDDSYPAPAGDEVGEYVEYRHFDAGERAYQLLAVGESVDGPDVPLASAGDGSLKVAAAASEEAPADHVVCHSYEAVDNSAGDSHARIRVEY